MQFLGLKDHNGDEIYEGDILNPNFPEDGPCCSTVIFEDGSFRKKYPAWKETLDKPHISEREIEVVRLIVIGNIYENPELLDA